METYYEILEVTQDASEEVIRASYKALVKKYHPDNGNNDSNSLERLAIINEAYEILSDQEKRKEYDELLKKKSFYTNNHYSDFTNASVKSSDDVAYDYNSVNNIDEVKGAISGGVISFVAWKLLAYFSMRRIYILIAAGAFAIFLGELTGYILTMLINHVILKNTQLNSDDKSLVEGFFILGLMRKFLGYFYIDNWFSKLCLICWIIVILCLLKKVLDIIIKK